MKEVWKDLKCLESVYQVSNMGRLRRTNSKREIKSFMRKYA